MLFGFSFSLKKNARTTDLPTERKEARGGALLFPAPVCQSPPLLLPEERPCPSPHSRDGRESLSSDKTMKTGRRREA